MKAYAEFINDNGNLFRRKTLLQFGNSLDLIGSAILINPGESNPLISSDFDKKLIKSFYKKIHDTDENLENWHVSSIDSTMTQLKKIFDGWYLNSDKCKNLNGVIQIFNCFYFKDQNLTNALNNFSKESNYTFKENKFLKQQPVYFGWGNVGKSGLLREIAEGIFNSYDHSFTPIYEMEFEKNCFYHPGYVNRSYAKSIKTKKLTTDFFQLFKNEKKS